MLDALFFGAHPDDVELSSGGLASLLAFHGHAVGIADLTRGERGTRGTVEERGAEAAAAARELGLLWRGNLDLPDLGLARGDRAQQAALVACLREHRPRLVVAPDPDDAHPDHVEASRLVARACYLAGLARFDADLPHTTREPRAASREARAATRDPRPALGGCPAGARRVPGAHLAGAPRGPGGGPAEAHEVPGGGAADGPVRHRPERLLFALYRGAAPAHLVVDVSAVWEQRMRAVRSYASQLDSAHGPATYLTAPGFLEEIEARARALGALIGARYGEGYRLRGPVPITDARALLPAGLDGGAR
jgi:LmbE family N-acetylglucosaminyl deacetylase